MSIDTIDVCNVTPSHKKLNTKGEYCFESGPLTQTIAKEVINILRTGHGKVSIDSVHRILRKAYSFFSQAKNITHIKINSNDEVNVVCDIHSHLSDLVHILDEAGDPNLHNKYIFNCDFIDRGTHSVEVILILLILQISHLEEVFFKSWQS